MPTDLHEPLDLTNTRAALAAFDKREVELDQLASAAQTNEDVYAWEAAVKDAEDKVREAFYADTNDRNSLDRCMLVGIDWLRQLCKRFP